MVKVGLFFYVKGELLTDLVDVNHAELYGECRTGKSSHFDIWDERYYKIYRTPYDYFPRGRVVYKYKEDKYILYADKCIDDNGINKIIQAFCIENENIEIDTTDIHYVCRKCNKIYVF